MCKRKAFLLVASILFILIEATLGYLIQTAEGLVAHCYSAVVIACYFFLLFAEKSPTFWLTQIGLFYTVCADWFLVVLVPMRQLTAMLFFSVTQLAYAVRLYLDSSSRRRRMLQIWVRAALSVFAIVLTASVLQGSTDPLALVSLFCYATLIGNVIFAFAQGKRNLLFAIGLLFFLCCDTLIGLSCLGQYFPIAEDSMLYTVINPGFNLAWAFYVPSQALIALSLLPKKLKVQKNEPNVQIQEPNCHSIL